MANGMLGLPGSIGLGILANNTPRPYNQGPPSIGPGIAQGYQMYQQQLAQQQQAALAQQKAEREKAKYEQEKAQYERELKYPKWGTGKNVAGQLIYTEGPDKGTLVQKDLDASNDNPMMWNPAKELKMGDKIVMGQTHKLDPSKVKVGNEIMSIGDFGGDRHKQTTTIVNEAPDLGFLTDTQRGKVVNEMMGKETALINSIHSSNDLLKQVEADPAVLGVPGRLATFVDSFTSQFTQIGRVIGADMSKVDLASLDYSAFKGVAANTAAFKSMATNLAYQAAAASGQTGRDVSNADVQRFLNEIAGTAGSPGQVVKVISKFQSRMIRNFNTYMDIRTKNEPLLKAYERSEIPELYVPQFDTPIGGATGGKKSKEVLELERQLNVELEE